MESRNKIMADNYYKNSPKKRMGAGALIFNAKGEILFVKAGYRDNWTLPGGVIEEDESPQSACLREVREEVGLDLKTVNFLCVDYISKFRTAENRGENMQFVFFGGKLSASEIEKIKVDGQEIIEHRFMKIDEAWPLISEKLRLRLPKCLAALENNTAVYLECGE